MSEDDKNPNQKTTSGAPEAPQDPSPGDEGGGNTQTPARIEDGSDEGEVSPLEAVEPVSGATDGASQESLPLDDGAGKERAESPPREGKFGGQSLGLPESWKVHLPIFEGPMDLLLHLIKINEVDVYDIPVVLICDQFHEYLALMEDLDLDVAGEFIYEAALLIQLKSRLLLPKPKVAEGEQEEDPREFLVQRLLEYQRLKEAAQELGEVDRLRMGIWTRDAGRPTFQGDDDDEVDLGDLSLFDLLAAFKRVLVRYDQEHPPPMHLRGETFSVRDQFHRLLGALEVGRPYDLLDDLRMLSGRSEAIAAFLAILEMAKLNLLRVHQTEKGEILLYRTTRELQEHELELIQG